MTSDVSKEQNEAAIHERMDEDSRFPNHVRIIPGRGIEIDGEKFPWYLTSEPDPVTVTVGSKQLTTVTVRIPCNTVEILDTPLPAEGRVDDYLTPIFRTTEARADANGDE